MFPGHVATPSVNECDTRFLIRENGHQRHQGGNGADGPTTAPSGFHSVVTPQAGVKPVRVLTTYPRKRESKDYQSILPRVGPLLRVDVKYPSNFFTNILRLVKARKCNDFWSISWVGALFIARYRRFESIRYVARMPSSECSHAN